MTAAVIALAILKVAAWLTSALLVAAVWLWRSERREGRFTAATEAAIEQAVAIVDDGKALVTETEDYLRTVAG